MAVIEIIGILIGLFIFLVIPLLFILALFIRIVYEYERGIKFTLGRFSGEMTPGVNIVVPILQ